MIPLNDQLDGKDDEDKPCSQRANHGDVYLGHSSIIFVCPLTTSDHLVNYRADKAKAKFDSIDKYSIG